MILIADQRLITAAVCLQSVFCAANILSVVDIGDFQKGRQFPSWKVEAPAGPGASAFPEGPEGLPLEIYCFTSTTEWASYENIQSDIFDHLLAIVPEFGLRLYQKPAGSDLANFK